jgi:hypothetical protein
MQFEGHTIKFIQLYFEVCSSSVFRYESQNFSECGFISILMWKWHEEFLHLRIINSRYSHSVEAGPEICSPRSPTV